MNKYNYLEAMVEDIKDWMHNNDFNLSEYTDLDEVREDLYDELFAEESVTGNGLSWYDTEFKCEEYICHNLDLLFEAVFEYGETEEMLLDNIHKYAREKSFARWADCTIRCYLLSSAINEVLEEPKIFKHIAY